jgi:RecA-family ATPase
MALADAKVREHLATVLRQHPDPIVALDPFSSLFRGDENSTREMNEAKAHLEELACINPRALLVLCHHTSKSGERGEGGPGMYAARGSSILSGWADVQLNLKHERIPKGAGQVCFIATVEKHRDGERGYRCRVTVPLGGGEVTFAEVKDEAATDERAARILEVAKQSPGLSRDALAKAAGKRKATMLTVIDQLVAEGALVRRGPGYVVNDLPTDPEETTS